jgi:phospholipase A-2-activating protein
LILLHPLSSLGTNPSPEASHTLIGHSLNVSTLHYSSKRQKLISGSWDRTARVWSRSERRDGSEVVEEGGWECELVMEEHEEAVWGVLAIDTGPNEGCWLTSSGESAY